ncbi:glycosyltransferase [Francisella sp. SYW-2]|nr:glycosyltransferase [Francisella sp. SYW-2]
MLRSEDNIISKWRNVNKGNMVTILCQTYNQEQFIGQTLDSFLMQQTDFPFNIIVRDDASTDGTVTIIKDYQLKYPSIIKPIFEKENQWSKGITMIPREIPRIMQNIEAMYIALCDGDDYWTDSLKLQKQVDFLERNPHFVASAHASRYLRNGKEAELVSVPPQGKTEYTFEEYLGNCYFQTSSWVYRYDRKFRASVEGYFHTGGDVYMSLVFLNFGPFKYFNEVMSVWRVHDQGEWNKNSVEGQAMENLAASAKVANIFDKKYKPKFYELFYSDIQKISPKRFSELVLKNYSRIDAQEVIGMLAEVVVDSESPIAKELDSKRVELASRDATIKECNEYIKLLEDLLEAEKNKNLLKIIKSRVFKKLK